MSDDYVAEILRAADSLRAGDPAGVSAIIQSALAAAGLTGSLGVGLSGRPKPGFNMPPRFSCPRVRDSSIFRPVPIGCGSP